MNLLACDVYSVPWAET